MPGVIKSFAYMRGVLAGMGYKGQLISRGHPPEYPILRSLFFSEMPNLAPLN